MNWEVSHLGPPSPNLVLWVACHEGSSLAFLRLRLLSLHHGSLSSWCCSPLHPQRVLESAIQVAAPCPHSHCRPYYSRSH